MKPLWPHQARAIDSLKAALRAGYRRPVLQLPTGAGKTRTAAEIVSMGLAKRSRIVFTVPAISLIDQTVEAFWNEGIRDIGVIQSNHPMTDPSRKVQIASVDTLNRRARPEADLVIVDEAHRQSKAITEWLSDENCAALPFIGLSATPWAPGMGRLWDKLIIGSTTKELIELGVLSPFKVFAPSHPDLVHVKTTKGDYDIGQLSAAMQKGGLVGDIVTTWLERGGGGKTLVFAVDLAHARKLQKAFEDAGVRAGYIEADTPVLERQAIGKQLACGELQVVCNVGTLTTGVDWDIRCIVLARPTKSEMLYVQILGRGLRTASGKDYLTVLDHSDTTLKLGFVTDIHHEKLNEGKLDESGSKAKERETPKPWDCPKCTHIVPSGVYICNLCGFQRQRQSKIESAAGELVELDGKRAPKPPSAQEKRVFQAELYGLAIERGKTRGWADSYFKQKYGHWPKEKETCSPINASIATRSWVKSRQIAYAKGRNAVAAH